MQVTKVLWLWMCWLLVMVDFIVGCCRVWSVGVGSCVLSSIVLLRDVVCACPWLRVAIGCGWFVLAGVDCSLRFVAGVC